MDGYQLADFDKVRVSVAMTEATDDALAEHLLRGVCRGRRQEDLTFAFWRPSRGADRYTAIVHTVVLPTESERILQGNVAFTNEYLQRALRDVPADSGIALIHSHLGPGWQGMSNDDEVAERDRLGGAVAARTGLPVLGLTLATDRVWSARLWLRAGPNTYERRWASTVRVMGQQVRVSHHPTLSPLPQEPPSQAATISVWGTAAQADLARMHVGIVGLGSVGSIIAEALSRVGIGRITLIDHDVIEVRNLDRTLNARDEHALAKTPKVTVAAEGTSTSHTAMDFVVREVATSFLSVEGFAAALDCDVLMSCVDRPWPRAVLNAVAQAHLIPVVDGGILARVDEDGQLLHVDWRIHTVGAGRRCFYCLKALYRSDVALDRDGKLDDPDYVAGLSAVDRERYSRRNVFPFSLSVAAHQTLQLIGLVTGMARVGGVGPQHYSAYPGEMQVQETTVCEADCGLPELTGMALPFERLV